MKYLPRGGRLSFSEQVLMFLPGMVILRFPALQVRFAVYFSSTGASQVLTEGEETMSFKGKNISNPQSFSLMKAASWRTGQFYFTNEQLSKVFDELGRQYNVNISTCKIDNRFYTGFFSNKSLKEALELIVFRWG